MELNFHEIFFMNKTPISIKKNEIIQNNPNESLKCSYFSPQNRMYLTFEHAISLHHGMNLSTRSLPKFKQNRCVSRHKHEHTHKRITMDWPQLQHPNKNIVSQLLKNHNHEQSLNISSSQKSWNLLPVALTFAKMLKNNAIT